MLPTEEIQLGNQYTWSISSEYIGIRDERMVLRIPNDRESHVKYKEATAKMGESIVFYGGNDMKLYFELDDDKVYLKLFSGRKNLVSYTNRYFLSLFRLFLTRYGPVEVRKIPADAENAVTFEQIPDGERMVNFHDEYKHDRYYTQSTYEKLPVPKMNPYTRKAIESYKVYQAKRFTRKSR